MVNVNAYYDLHLLSIALNAMDSKAMPKSKQSSVTKILLIFIHMSIYDTLPGNNVKISYFNLCKHYTTFEISSKSNLVLGSLVRLLDFKEIYAFPE